MLSFVIYFHSCRIDNLRQTLRFLEKREPKLHGSEIVLICQDVCGFFESPHFRIRQTNLNLRSYHKPLMCNLGVSQATGNIIVLLDSDRVLPKNYFHDAALTLKRNQIVAPHCLYQLGRPYTDEEIEAGPEKTPDFRSEVNESRFKNAFAGNTMMWRDEYWGMDESFIGYGYADSDMTRDATVRGFELLYPEVEELHLWHEKQIEWRGKMLGYPAFEKVAVVNAVKYAEKWGLDDQNIKGLVEEVKRL